MGDGLKPDEETRAQVCEGSASALQLGSGGFEPGLFGFLITGCASGLPALITALCLFSLAPTQFADLCIAYLHTLWDVSSYLIILIILLVCCSIKHLLNE